MKCTIFHKIPGTGFGKNIVHLRQGPFAMIEIKKEKDNTYRFNLRTTGGKILLKSVHFPDKETIRKTVVGLSPMMESASVFERKTDHSGKFLFNLKDPNGKIIGSSQTYSSEAGMENGIKNLKIRIAALADANAL
ncbi:YegP family protein [Flavobacteriaceae bacterium 3-367]